MIKRRPFCVIFLIIVGVISLFGLTRCWISQINQSAYSHALVSDVVDYVRAHNGTMPKDWQEFQVWLAMQPNANRWDPSGLDRRFALPWGAQVCRLQTQEFIIVLAPDLKYLKSSLNHRLQDQLNGLHCYALVSDVVDYVKADSGTMPKDWQEFQTWLATQPKANRWEHSGLEQRFALAWGAQVSKLQTQEFIVVLAPDLKYLEPYLNKHFRDNCANLCGK